MNRCNDLFVVFFVNHDFEFHRLTSSASIIAQINPDVLRIALIGHFESVNGRIVSAQTFFRSLPYVILANQFVCVAWFAEQDKYAELFETNKRMTLWLIDKFAEVKDIYDLHIKNLKPTA